jgi:arylsulfatase A-like enzyme
VESLSDTPAVRGQPVTCSRAPLTPRDALLLAAGFGLAAGYLDVAGIVLDKQLLETPPYYKRGWFFPWTVPVGNLAILMVPGLLVAGIAGLRPGLVSLRAAAWLFATLALAGPLTNLPIYSSACWLLAVGLARWISRGVEALGPRPRRWVGRGLAGTAGLLAVSAAIAMGRQALAEHNARSRPAPSPGAPNVLLIVLDTVRAESLSLYGYDRETTPQLTRWARRGVRFDRAVAPSSWTYPSHSCFFTGQWPYKLDSHWQAVLDASYPTLAEFLGDRGYRTGGFVANTSYCSYESGLARGFAHYEDYALSCGTILASTSLGRWVTANATYFLSDRQLPALKWIQYLSRDARGINRAFLDWLSREDRGERPFFAFLNYLDAHEPFLVPEEPTANFGLHPESRADYETLMNYWAALDKTRITPRQVALVHDAYDDCIAYLDRQVGSLLDELDRRGVLRNTVVIITSDHGEEFGEHGVFNHGFSLYLHELLVPLVILSPSAPRGGVVAEPVSLRDLPATVVDLLGLAGGSAFPGHSLAAHWRPATGVRPVTSPALSELNLPVTEASEHHISGATQWGYSMSMVAGDSHYIRDSREAEELYDLAGDRPELHNRILSPGSYAAISRFRRSLLRLLSDDPIPPGKGEKYVKRYRILLESLVPASQLSGEPPKGAQEDFRDRSSSLRSPGTTLAISDRGE